MWIEITYLFRTSTSQPFNCGDGLVFNPSLFCAFDYTSMLVLKLIHVSKNVLGVVARKKYVNILVFYFCYWLCINWRLSYTIGTVSSAGNKKNHSYIYIYIYIFCIFPQNNSACNWIRNILANVKYFDKNCDEKTRKMYWTKLCTALYTWNHVN